MPPNQGLRLDVDAISGICGSISIACWVVVFSPQIIENFRRRSAEGLSLLFIIVWLLGDVFNILGAVLQGVLPTMIILAVYYTLADIILLAQCLYYRRLTPSSSNSTPSKPSSPTPAPHAPTEHSPLLSAHDADHHRHHRRRSSAFRDHDFTHLSPSMPMTHPHPPSPSPIPPPPSTLTTILQNTTAILLVCASGVGGWYLSPSSRSPPSDPTPSLPTFSPLGQVFGYLCAVLYLGSRIPQILLNARRRSTEGVSLLFFLFACVGNLTYVLSILAYAPPPAPPGVPEDGQPRTPAALYARYILVNLSWLLGSLGTLVEDLVIFAQFFAYRQSSGSGDSTPEAVVDGDGQEHANGVAVE